MQPHIDFVEPLMLALFVRGQWRNRRGAGGQSAPPETCDREIFADISGKKRQGKKRKWVKIEKKRWEIGNGSRKTVEKEVRTFFFFFFAFHFWKRRKFFLGLPKWEFSIGKKHFAPGKKSGKMTLPPQKNMPVTPLSGGKHGRPKVHSSSSKCSHETEGVKAVSLAAHTQHCQTVSRFKWSGALYPYTHYWWIGFWWGLSTFQVYEMLTFFF